jgi:glycogen operon protein
MGAHCHRDAGADTDGIGNGIRTGEGVNFAVYSAHATAIELCLFDEGASTESIRLRLPACTDGVFHGRVPGLRAGQLYGLRAHGPWAPEAGHRFNPAKLLLDPFAREIVGEFEWRPEHFASVRGDLSRIDGRDNAAWALKARVTDDRIDRAGDTRPFTPLARSVIYEMHVKGFSVQNPDVPAPLRGTYAGLGHAASIAHLQRLGITAVCLLPVHQRVDEERLVRMGLTNYWGYNTIGFFCPEPRLAAAREGHAIRTEFRAMVQSLHAAGIEVILDVVFNHTAETDSDGPSLAWRGLDNAGHYRLAAIDRRVYENHTGCGNTLDIRAPAVLKMVLDSLRYWVTEMQVDGYRFDLATVLGRSRNGGAGFDPQAAFFAAVAQDPVLAGVKMIAEPWDIGDGGYQLGAFPRGWAEWNDRFRDTMRNFWLRGDAGRGAFAQRLCGSSDVFEGSGRAPAASINYVISHDGFTLRDLVSYEHKHNLANGEDNRDGTDANLGRNCGAEGPSDDPSVNALRGRLQRVLLATTLLAQGTPMLAAGDELGHSQGGNNNPYCQDNAITWIDWAQADPALLAFTARVIELRRTRRPLADGWYARQPGPASLVWLGADGRALDDAAWADAGQRALGCLIGSAEQAAAPLLLLCNGGAWTIDFLLPPGRWTPLLDTVDAIGSETSPAGPALALAAHSLVLLGATSA